MRSLEEMRTLFKDKGYNLLSTEYKGNKSPLTFEKDGYLYFNTYNGFIKTNNPKRWGINNPYSIDNLKKYLKEEGATCEVLSDSYDCNLIRLKCECGNEYDLCWSNLITTKQYTCPLCGHQRGGDNHRIDEKYIPLLGKYEFTLCEKYKGSKFYHKVRTKEGYFTRVQPYILSTGANPYDFVFNLNNPYTMDNIKLWLKINGDGLEIISNEYKGAKEKYKFKCPCGEIFETGWQYVYLKHITRCPKCNHATSSLEIKVKEWLEEHRIKYEQEKIYPDCVCIAPLRFDFYLSDYNRLVEVDGEQHYRPATFGGISYDKARKNFETSQIRDKIKNKYCEENGIPLLRIPYTAFKNDEYKNILQAFTAKN